MDTEGHARKSDSGLLKRIGAEWRKFTPLGWVWCLIALIMVGLGSVLVLVRPSQPAFGWIQRAAPIVQQDAWLRLIGIYVITVAINMIVIHPLMIRLRYWFGLEREVSAQNGLPTALVGVCEAVLYPTSWLVGKPEFIGVWLALKTAAGWKLWQKETGPRAHFQMFLIGNALSIVLGSLSFFFMRGFVLEI